MAKIIKANFGDEGKKAIKENDNNINNVNGRKNVSLKLSLIEREEAIISNIQKENLTEELESFPPVYDGDINIVGVYAFDMGNSWEVKAFLRNGMNRPINFDKVAFVIVNSKNEVLAAQTFNMEDSGDIPAYSARPYKLNFDKTNVYVDKIPADDWYIAFDSNVGTAEFQDFEFEGLPDSLSEQNRTILDNFLKTLPKIEKGNYDLSKFSIGINESGELIISIVLRNSLDKPLSIDRLPVTIKNEEGTKVFSTIFDIHDFKVSTGKAKIINLICKTDIQLNQDMDLSNWNIEFRI